MIISCLKESYTHRPQSSSLLGLPYRILNINHKKELLRGLWVYTPESWNRVVAMRYPTLRVQVLSNHKP